MESVSWIDDGYRAITNRLNKSRHLLFFLEQKCREGSNITRITNSLARLDGEKIARKGIGGRKMKISFSRSAITRHEARDRSLEHELIEKRGGVAVHGSKDAEGEEKEKRRQRSVDLLLSL